MCLFSCLVLPVDRLGGVWGSGLTSGSQALPRGCRPGLPALGQRGPGPLLPTQPISATHPFLAPATWHRCLQNPKAPFPGGRKAPAETFHALLLQWHSAGPTEDPHHSWPLSGEGLWAGHRPCCSQQAEGLAHGCWLLLGVRLGSGHPKASQLPSKISWQLPWFLFLLSATC